MTLKEKRKYVAEYAKKANKILQETRAENPHFLKGRWESALTKSTVATKKGTFRQSAPYKMNTEQLNKYMTKLNQFVRDVEHKTKDQARYTASGFPNAHSLVERLAKDFFKYYYADGYPEFYDRTKTILQNMTIANDISESDALRIVENAFYAYGDFDAAPPEKPHIEYTGYYDDISQGGKYL